MNRRQFVRVAACATALSTASGLPGAGEPRLKAAIIGHTGRGDYGHGLDAIFTGRTDVELVAVADADPAGLARARVRLGNIKGYADYRDLLLQERPQLVSVSPRHADQHHAMGMAALKAGAHLFMEKPFTPTLAEADDLLAEADRRGLKIVVAHQMRLDPAVVRLNQTIAGGLIGDLLEVRAFGKQDERAGGEDMMVLGCHLFDLVRLFAGDPLGCAARVLEKGREITPSSGRPVKDNVGLVAGDEVFAHFSLPNGVNATFFSRRKLRDYSGNWGLELIGAKGAARLNANIPPKVFLLKSSGWKDSGRQDSWEPVPDSGAAITARDAFKLANGRLADDWLEAIRHSREPECSGRNAMKAVEMIMAVYHAALTGRRIEFPLANRAHPLTSP